MTDVLDRVQQTLDRPTADTFAVLRQEGLLPAETRESQFKADPTQAPPAFAALAQIDPKKTFTPARASMSISNAQSFYTNSVTGEAFFQSETGRFTALFVSFENLGANRQLIGYFDLRVFGPLSASLTIGGTGNPSTTVVTRTATGAARTLVPFGMKSLPDGRALAYVVPTLVGHGGVWYGTSLYGF